MALTPVSCRVPSPQSPVPVLGFPILLFFDRPGRPAFAVPVHALDAENLFVGLPANRERHEVITRRNLRRLRAPKTTTATTALRGHAWGAQQPLQLLESTRERLRQLGRTLLAGTLGAFTTTLTASARADHRAFT